MYSVKDANTSLNNAISTSVRALRLVETLDLSPNRQTQPSLTVGAPSVNFRFYGIQISSFFKHFLSQCLDSVGAGSANMAAPSINLAP